MIAVQSSEHASAGQSGVKGTVIGAQYVRRAQGLVKTTPLDRFPTPPLKGVVGPDDAQVRRDDRHSFLQDGQDGIGLKQGGGALVNCCRARVEKDPSEGSGLP